MDYEGKHRQAQRGSGRGLILAGAFTVTTLVIGMAVGVSWMIEQWSGWPPSGTGTTVGSVNVTGTSVLDGGADPEPAAATTRAVPSRRRASRRPTPGTAGTAGPRAASSSAGTSVRTPAAKTTVGTRKQHPTKTAGPRSTPTQPSVSPTGATSPAGLTSLAGPRPTTTPDAAATAHP